MKKKLLIGAFLCICLSIAAGGTLAYFTAENTAHNVITTGGIDIALQEWSDEEQTTAFPEKGIDNVMPGTSVTKIVEVENTGSNDAYIRVKVDKSITLAGEGEPDLDLLVLDMNDEEWTKGEDGYYYYNEPLAPHEETEPLFTTVTFAGSMNNMYQNSSASVDVTAYAVQVANNGDTVMEAKGWPDTNQGGNAE